MPLTKIHPILLGKQKGGGNSEGGGGGSLLAKHRQQHQANQERRQQHEQQHQQMPSPSSGPNQMSGPPPGYGGYNNQQPPPMNNHQPPPMNNHMQYPAPPQQNMYQQPPPPSYNAPSSGYPPPPHMQQFNNQMQPPPPKLPQIEYHKKPPPPNEGRNDGTPKRKRRSRWGDKDDRAIVTGPTTLPADMSEEQRKHYLLQFKIEEITVKLRTGELGIPADPMDRSPSPEPIYNSEGKRLNTREFRVRRNLEEERHALIKQAIDDIPSYKPPIDYKPPMAKICDKVFIPAERNPAVNFIGLLIGPRGNTLKRLEKETGCKIIIRGKGSVKEGKVGRIPGQLMPGEDEPLHALITGPTEKEVKVGVKVVTDIVKEGIECPDAANELRRNQLRELAELNGTLIDEEIIKCKNCGATDHRHWECQEQKNVTSQITCHKCGGYGHVAADCKANNMDIAAPPIQTFSEKAKMDTEYMSLMAELGVDGPPAPKRTFTEKPPEAQQGNRQMESPNQNSFQGDRRNENPNNSRNNDGGNRKRESKWGPPPPANNSPAPKSLMDVNVGPGANNQFRGPAPPQNNQGAPPWMNQQRGPNPNMQPPPHGNSNAPPWQQGPPRGPPPGFGAPPPQQNMPPPSGYPQQNPAGAWQQPPPPTGYPNQWQQQSYGAYNPYQQMQQQPYSAAPAPPWTQQPPPPPPPPPPSS